MRGINSYNTRQTRNTTETEADYANYIVCVRIYKHYNTNKKYFYLALHYRDLD